MWKNYVHIHLYTIRSLGYRNANYKSKFYKGPSPDGYMWKIDFCAEILFRILTKKINTFENYQLCS